MALITREGNGGELLVEIGDHEENDRRDGDDVAEMRVDQEHRQQVDRRSRRIEHRQDHRAGQEAADLLEIGQRLELAVGAGLRGLGRGGEHRAAEPAFDIDRHAHQHEPPHHVEQDMGTDRDHDDQRQHDEGIEAAAGQHAVRHLEEIDRHGEHQGVHHDGKHRHDHQIVPGTGKPLAEDLLEVAIAETLLDRRAAARAATATAASSAIALAAAVAVMGRPWCLGLRLRAQQSRLGSRLAVTARIGAQGAVLWRRRRPDRRQSDPAVAVGRALGPGTRQAHRKRQAKHPDRHGAALKRCGWRWCLALLAHAPAPFLLLRFKP